VHGWMDKRTDRLMDGWIGLDGRFGWMDGWMDGWRDVLDRRID
jgi:hypothetical protein